MCQEDTALYFVCILSSLPAGGLAVAGLATVVLIRSDVGLVVLVHFAGLAGLRRLVRFDVLIVVHIVGLLFAFYVARAGLVRLGGLACGLALSPTLKIAAALVYIGPFIDVAARCIVFLF